MSTALFIIVLCLVYLYESMIRKAEPKLIRYVIAALLFFSYNYLSAEDDDDDVRHCYSIQLNDHQIDWFNKQMKKHNEEGDWALQQAKDSTLRISIPEEQTMITVAVESLIASLITADSRSRAVALCLVCVKEVVQKSMHSSKNCQSYLNYAEYCYAMAEFYGYVLQRGGRTDTCEVEDLEFNSPIDRHNVLRKY